MASVVKMSFAGAVLTRHVLGVAEEGMVASATKIWLAACMGLTLLALPSADAADTYVFKQYIAIPASADNPIEGKFATFDIGAFDGMTQMFYLSDRSNASIDVFSARTNSFVGRIGGREHLFTGQRAPNSGSGPTGLLVVSQGWQILVYE